MKTQTVNSPMATFYTPPHIVTGLQGAPSPASQHPVRIDVVDYVLANPPFAASAAAPH